MRKPLLFTGLILFLLCFVNIAVAQNQVVTNGQQTTPVNFPGTGCVYNWVNNNPSIGLPASGTGNIPSFNAVNSGGTPVTATITATPAPTGFAYMANYGEGTVSVDDIATNSSIALIKVGSTPFGVSLSPDGSRIYVTNNGDNSVSVINTATNLVLNTISVSQSPWGIAASPDGNKVFVVNKDGNSVSVINTTTGLASTTVNVGLSPWGACVSPDGSKVYVTNNGSASVSIINAVTNTVTGSIPLLAGSAPQGICISPDGGRVYVANALGSVSVINTATNLVVANITVGSDPYGICVSPDGGRVYVTNNEDPGVSVINTTTNTVVKTIYTTSVGYFPEGISVSPDGSVIYVAVTGADVAAAYNTTTSTVISTSPTGLYPGSFGNFVHFTNSGCGTTPVKFTITVNPTASSSTITASAATGTISACSGTASASPDIQQFIVSGSNLADGITLTAPAGFEISLAPNNSYSNSIELTQTNGTIPNNIIYVRSAATAPVGSIPGKITLTSAGAATQTVAVTGTVNAPPTVNSVADQVFSDGATTPFINFAGTASGFAWSNNTPAIGLAATGTGGIPSFTAINTGSSPVTATVTVTPSSPGLAYITNQGSNTVSVLNTENNNIIATIPAGKNPNGVSVTPDGAMAYIGNAGDNTVSVVNTSTNKVISTIRVGKMPYGVTVSPDGKSVYVANFTDNTVSIIKTATNEIAETVPAGKGAYAIAVSPDNSRVYVSDYFDNAVSVLNAANGTLLATIGVGQMPEGMVISPDGKFVYAINDASQNVSVISTATNTVAATIAIGNYITFAIINADGSRLYVANTAGNSVAVINTATNTIVSTIPVGASPVGLSFNSEGSELYIANSGSGTVTVINAATNGVVSIIPVGAAPTSFGNFITHGANCSGTPIKFTITVQPSATAAGIIAGAATGSINTCAGTASTSTQQITVSGTGLTADIVATAPSGFEVSLSQTGGFGANVTLKQSGGTVGNTVVYIRSSSSASIGNISGKVTLTSTGAANQVVPVAGIVNASPMADAVANQVVAVGQLTTAVNFTGTGNTYNWVNDTPGIGLAASGTGNIASFSAINAGTAPIKATVTVTPSSGPLAYVSNYTNNTVSVVNTLTKAIVATIAVGNYPTFVTASPDGSHVYVANNGSSTISVINTSTNKVTATIPVGQPDQVRVSPDGSKLYVVEYGTNTIGVVNTATNIEIAHIPVGSGPADVITSPDGSTLYVSNVIDKTVSVVSTATNKLITTIAVGAYPIALNISPDGGRVYVSNFNANNVSVINTATNTVIANVNTGVNPDGLIVSPDGSKVYVANYGGTTVSVIDAATNTIVSTISVGNKPVAVGVSADGSLVFASNQQSHDISEIDAATNSVIATIPLPAGSNELFVSGGTGCTGVPETFTITVNPAALITASAASGAVYACAGQPSASPNIQQVNVSGSNLADNIVVTVTSGFEVSLSPGGGYGNTVTLSQTGGTVPETIVYVRSSASASTGKISGNVSFTSAGASRQSVPVAGFVNALPTVNQLSNVIYENAATTAPVHFSGTGSTYSWVNNTPGIGLAATGTGDIASFKTINTTTSPITATITVFPQSAGYAYIGNSTQNTLSVINTVTNAVVTTIPVDSDPFGVAVSPDGSRVYVSNHGSNNISVISTVTNTVISNLTVGKNPQSMVISPDGGTLYITYGEDNPFVSVVNTANGQVRNIPTQNWNYGIAISPDGSKVYIVNNVFNTVSVMTTANDVITATIPAGSGPYGAAVSPDGSRLYVTVNGDNDVLVINTADNSLIAKVAVGNTPTGLCISPDGSNLYVMNNNSANVSVIATATNKVTATVGVGMNGLGLSITPDGKWLYAPSYQDDNVSVINTVTNQVAATVKVGTNPISFGNFVTGPTGCTGTPSTFTITIGPSVISGITIGPNSGTEPLTTVYGTPSASESFEFSAAGLTAGVLVTPPAGFEVSTDGKTFSSTVTVGTSGTITDASVYIRLAATTPVGVNYAGSIVLSSAGVPTVDNEMSLSTVTPAPLTITADNKSRAYDVANPVLTVTYTGFVNNETAAVLTAQPVLATTVVLTSPPGQYPITVSGAASPNYTITFIPGTFTIGQAVATIVIPNTFTPNGDGINDTWDIKNIDLYLNCTVMIYNRYGENVYSSIGYGIPWDGKYNGAVLPTGTYYYVINLKNSNALLSGFVAIIR